MSALCSQFLLFLRVLRTINKKDPTRKPSRLANHVKSEIRGGAHRVCAWVEGEGSASAQDMTSKGVKRRGNHLLCWLEPSFLPFASCSSSPSHRPVANSVNPLYRTCAEREQSIHLKAKGGLRHQDASRTDSLRKFKFALEGTDFLRGSHNSSRETRILRGFVPITIDNPLPVQRWPRTCKITRGGLPRENTARSFRLTEGLIYFAGVVENVLSSEVFILLALERFGIVAIGSV